MTKEEADVAKAREHLAAVYAIATERLVNARKRLEGKCTHPAPFREPHRGPHQSKTYGKLCTLCLSVNYWDREYPGAWLSVAQQREETDHRDRD